MAPSVLRTLMATALLAADVRARSAASVSPQAPCADGPKYLITFGDSYSQTGFDINGAKPSASNPLGNPQPPGWTASGGLNWVGFLASQFNTSLLLTYNFAYGGATTDATLVKPWRDDVLSFIDQMKQFSGSIAAKPEYAPWTASNSLFGVWIGVNDVGNIHWLPNATDIIGLIMDRYFEQLKIMYDAGARNFVLLSVPPIDRSPLMIAQGEAATSGERVIIKYYNGQIAGRLANFTAENEGAVGKVVDTQAPFNTALDNPTAYGSPNATCWDVNGNSCLWFNDYHPGVAINKLVAQAVADAWKGSFF